MAEDKAMHVKMAFLYVQSGEWYKAIEEYKILLKEDPYDPHVYNMMGDAYAKKKDDKDAFNAYLESRELYTKLGNMQKVNGIDKKIAKLSGENMDIKQRQKLQSFIKTQEAESLAAGGKLEEAVAYYTQLIAAEPINFSYREKLANLFLDHAMVTEASAQLKAIADIHLSEGRLDLAMEYAGKMSLMDPEGLENLRLHAVLAKRMGDKAGVAKHSGRLGQLTLEAGQYEEAKSALEEAVGAGRADLRPLLAKALMSLKKYPEAKAQFEALLQENPGDDALVEQLLTLSEETKDWNAAYVHMNTVLAKRPDDPKLQPRLARVLLQVGKRADALLIYQKLAATALAENRPEAAFSYFDSILALDPENIEILKKKAEIYLKQSKKQEVIDIYKKIQAIYVQKKMVEDAKKIGLVLTRLQGLK